MRRILLSVLLLVSLAAGCSSATPLAPASPVLPVAATPGVMFATAVAAAEATAILPPVPSGIATSAVTRPTVEATSSTGAVITPNAGTEWDVYAGALRPGVREGVDFRGMTQYHLTVDLPADLSAVHGSARVQYTNRAKDSLDRIYLHLYPNLWHAGMTVSGTQVNGQTAPATLQSQGSLLEVMLPTTLKPGQSIDLTLDFSVPIPHNADVGNYGEFAYLDGVLALAQFYPTVVVYDDHWHLETPALQGDVLFNQASLYDVTLTAPVTMTVAATGRTVATQDNADGTTTWHLAGGPMRDFNIVASDRYRKASKQAGDITVNSFFLPEDASGGQDALNFAADALATYQKDFGAYPYTELDVVETATKALGIEYPGLIVLARHGQYDTQGRRDVLEATTAHEVAHQWWYNVVGDDQINTPWMDEALAQYSTYIYFKDTHGAPASQDMVANFKSRWDQTQDADIPIGLPVASYRGPEYSAIVYGRGPLFFRALQDRIGESKMLQFLQEYYRQYDWRIANPAEFQDLLRQVSGQDLTDLFNQWVFPKK